MTVALSVALQECSLLCHSSVFSGAVKYATIVNLLYQLSLSKISSLLLLLLMGCCRYVATELPLRYRKLVSKTSRCYVVVAGLWTAALVTFIAPLLTKPNWSYYRYNVNQKMCGLHWEYPFHSIVPASVSASLLPLPSSSSAISYEVEGKEKEGT